MFLNPARRLSILFPLALLLLALLFHSGERLAAEPAANNLFVSPTGSGLACSQADPCSLATAVSQAVDGDTIYVAAGTYTGSDPHPEVAQLNSAVSLLGGWNGAPGGAVVRDPAAHVTIIDGEGVRRGLTMNKAGTIDGFTIQNGAGVNNGAGIMAETGETGTAVISNNIITNSVAIWYGGGVTVGIDATAVIENNQFFGNKSGNGGMSGFGGGGLFTWAFSTVTVANNLFQANQSAYGAAISVDKTNLVIENNRFIANVSPSVVDLSTSGSYTALVQNNLFANNTGYGLDVSGYTNVHVLHNTFTGNGAGGAHISAVTVSGGGSAVLMNNILANHPGASIFLFGGATVSGSHNLFWQNDSDPHLLSDPVFGDPVFVNPGRGDYRLGLLSAAVDRGTNASVIVDFEGHLRPLGRGFDIGFDEQTRRRIQSPGNYTFEDTGAQMNINQVGDLDSIGVVLVDEDHPDADGDIGLGRYWSIRGETEEGEDASGFNLTLTLPRGAAADPYICRWNMESWDCGRSAFDDDTVSRSDITAFSDWAIVDGYTPPIWYLYLPLVVR